MKKDGIKIISEVKDIADDMIQTKDPSVLVGYYETVVDALNYLIKTTVAEFTSGELVDPDIDGYDDAYYLQYDGDEIWVGKAKYDDSDKCIMFDEKYAFVEEDFADWFTDVNKYCTVVEFGYDDVHDEDPFCICMDDDKLGFTFCMEDEDGFTKFKYRGSSKLTEADIRKMLHENDLI